MKQAPPHCQTCGREMTDLSGESYALFYCLPCKKDREAKFHAKAASLLKEIKENKKNK